MNQPASQQTQALVDNLSKALVAKAELLEKLEDTNVTLKVIRSALQGIQIGQQLEREVVAEKELAELNANVPAPPA